MMDVQLPSKHGVEWHTVFGVCAAELQEIGARMLNEKLLFCPHVWDTRPFASGVAILILIKFLELDISSTYPALCALALHPSSLFATREVLLTDARISFAASLTLLRLAGHVLVDMIECRGAQHGKVEDRDQGDGVEGLGGAERGL